MLPVLTLLIKWASCYFFIPWLHLLKSSFGLKVSRLCLALGSVLLEKCKVELSGFFSLLELVQKSSSWGVAQSWWVSRSCALSPVFEFCLLSGAAVSFWGKIGHRTSNGLEESQQPHMEVIKICKPLLTAFPPFSVHNCVSGLSQLEISGVGGAGV